MNPILNVLIVEDHADDVLLIEQELRRGGFDPRCRCVQTSLAMSQALSDASWDVIICDYSLPHFGAIEALTILRMTGQDIPFIIVSGTIEEETAVSAMKLGVHNYIMKGNLRLLAPAIRRELQSADKGRVNP